MSTFLTVQHKTLSWTGLAQIFTNPLDIRARYLDRVRNNTIGVNIGDYFVISDDGGTVTTGDATWFAANFNVLGIVAQPPLTIQDSLSNPSRSANSSFGPLDNDRWAEVKYIVPVTISTGLLVAGGVARVDLKIGASTPSTLVDSQRNGVTGTTAINQTHDGNLVVCGLVPPGFNVEVDLVQVSGAVSFGSITAIERIL